LGQCYKAFLESDTYREFQERHSTNKHIGIQRFRENLCKCVHGPSEDSCVDLHLHGLQEYMTAINLFLLKGSESDPKFWARRFYRVISRDNPNAKFYSSLAHCSTKNAIVSSTLSRIVTKYVKRAFLYLISLLLKTLFPRRKSESWL